MSWFVLLAAGALEVVWAAALKRAVDAHSISWGVAALVAMAGSVALLSLALRDLPVGTAYAVWVGVGALGTSVVGIAVFAEPARPARLASLALLVLAIVALHLTGCREAPARTMTSKAAAPPPAMGVHGMVVFGAERLYASHLPLYAGPHDYQVVLELELEGAPAQAARDALAAGSLVTLEPERFDLTRLSPTADDPLREFTASIYAGHFERGGTRLGSVRVRVRAALLFRHLDATAAARPGWFAFGTSAATYLVHAIGPRPDADTIVAVEGAAPGAGVTWLDEEPTDDGHPAGPWLALHHFRAARVVYRETGDLE